MTERVRHVGVLAPRLVAAGLIELLRCATWAPAPWSIQSATPNVLVAWCRENDPAAFARTIAQFAACPIIVVAHLDRIPSDPIETSSGHAVRFVDVHVAPQELRGLVTTIATTSSPNADPGPRVVQLG